MSPCLTGSDLPVGPKVPLPPNDHPTQEGGLRLLEQLGLREKGHNADKAVMDHRSYEGAEKAESSEENWHRGGGGVVGVGGNMLTQQEEQLFEAALAPDSLSPKQKDHSSQLSDWLECIGSPGTKLLDQNSAPSSKMKCINASVQ